MKPVSHCDCKKRRGQHSCIVLNKRPRSLIKQGFNARSGIDIVDLGPIVDPVTMILTRIILAVALCVGCLLPAVHVAAEPVERQPVSCCGESCCCSPGYCPCAVEETPEPTLPSQAVPSQRVDDYRPAPRVPLPQVIGEPSATRAFVSLPVTRSTSGRALLLRKSVLLI